MMASKTTLVGCLMLAAFGAKDVSGSIYFSPDYGPDYGQEVFNAGSTNPWESYVQFRPSYPSLSSQYHHQTVPYIPGSWMNNYFRAYSSLPIRRPAAVPYSPQSWMNFGAHSSYRTQRPAAVPYSPESRMNFGAPSSLPTQRPAAVPYSPESRMNFGAHSSLPTQRPVAVPYSPESRMNFGAPSSLPTQRPAAVPYSPESPINFAAHSSLPTQRPAAMPYSPHSWMNFGESSSPPTQRPATAVPYSPESRMNFGAPSSLPTQRPAAIPYSPHSWMNFGESSSPPTRRPTSVPYSTQSRMNNYFGAHSSLPTQRPAMLYNPTTSEPGKSPGGALVKETVTHMPAVLDPTTPPEPESPTTANVSHVGSIYKDNITKIFRDGFTYGGHSYLLSRQVFISKDGSQSTCKLFNGYLAVIDDEEEWSAVSQYIKNASKSINRVNVLIDGTDRGHQGKWTLYSGEPIPVLKWGKGQPQGTKGRDCLLLHWKWNGLMSDTYCKVNGFKKWSFRYLCEIPDAALYNLAFT